MTTGGDVKVILDTVAGLTAVYRQAWVPDGAVLPYASWLDPISNVPALTGDARTLARRRAVQVDLWQDQAAEDDTLLARTIDALDGAKTPGGRLRVIEAVLVPGPEEDAGIIHHAITVTRAEVR